MNLLAFDTGTSSLSVALQRDSGTGLQYWHYQGEGGAKASALLVPTILDLLRQAGLQLTDLRAIAFGAGPGSFTGLRTACAVAQGLAYGADLPLLPIPSLLALAEQGREQASAAPAACTVTAVLDARMHELYVATYGFDQGQWVELRAAQVLPPRELAAYLHDIPAAGARRVLAGNAFAEYATELGPDAAFAAWTRVDALPTASALLRLAPQWLAAGRAVEAGAAYPLYVRDKVAQTTRERLETGSGRA